MTALSFGARQTLHQAGRFIVVGLAATAVHIMTALAVNAIVGLSPLWSNVAGFLGAVSVSYLGNWYWTFDAESRHGFALPRFLGVALLGFAVNHAMVFAICDVAGRPLWQAMIPVAVVVPALSFWLNKTRVFLAGRRLA
ncbi:MAG: GtrA family protein [Hyphomicrobiales bacterium]